MIVRMENFEFRCGNCGSMYFAPELVVGDYLLMRSEGLGSMRLFPKYENPIADELDRLVDEVPMAEHFPGYQIGRAGQRTYSIMVDPDIDGSRFVIGLDPRCPVCNWSAPADWRAPDPPIFVDVDVPVASFQAWQNLSADERRGRVRDAITDELSA